MREEFVTRRLVERLTAAKWTIASFDYPGSGTGRAIRPDIGSHREKNLGAIIPDIIAVRQSDALFFENKSDFFKPDIDLQISLRSGGPYDSSIKTLLKEFGSPNHWWFGVGLSSTSRNQRLLAATTGLDFALLVSSDNSISVVHSAVTIF